ncbi:MAG: hypothetical protein QXJ69_07875 [Desulfurococcaceae archaeon]
MISNGKSNKCSVIDTWDKLYFIINIVLIACFYTIPYTVLHTTKGFELFFFWITLTIVIGLLAVFNLFRKHRGGSR